MDETNPANPPKRTKRSRVRAVFVTLAAITAGLAACLVRTDRDPRELRAIYGAPPSRFVTVEGLATHYRDEGSGPPLLLIHGTSSSLHTWDGWTEAMSSRRRIVRLDLPGFGLTGPAPDRDYRAARYARFVAHFLDALGLDVVDVAGNSLGGRVATTFALDHPTRVRKLILVDAAGLSGQRPPTIFRLVRTNGLGPIVRWATPEWLIRRQLVEVYGDDSKVTDALVARHHALLRREGNRQALIDRLRGTADPSLDDRLHEIDRPTLIQWGSADPWIPVSFGERYARGIRGSTLLTYEGAGHVPMEERAAETARDADAFLGR